MDNCILLQFAKFSKGFKISDFDEFVEKFIGVENLDFLGRLAYPNQWQLRLTNTEIRNHLIRIGRTRINHRSCWMYPLNQQEIIGFVHWLPISVTTTQLEEHLNLYGTVLFTERQKRTIKFRDVESNPIYYGLMLPHGTVKEMLPHFLKINGYLCLIVVRGRQPACFHCKEVGHLRANCLKYKEMLDSYCNRDPNTAPLRLKPRGRRHLEVKNEVVDKIGLYSTSSSTDAGTSSSTDAGTSSSTDAGTSSSTDAGTSSSTDAGTSSSTDAGTSSSTDAGTSSSTDAVHTELEITVNEETTDQLPISGYQKNISETRVEIANGTQTELVETGVPVESRTNSAIAISTASFSETETLGLVETLRLIQQRTLEDFQISLKSFEKKIAEKIIPCIKNQINNREQFCAKVDVSTSTEMSEGDSNIDTETKEVKRDEKHYSQNMEQEQNIIETYDKNCKKTENMAMDIASSESLEMGSNNAPNTESFDIPVIEKTLQTPKEIIDSSNKIIEKLEENKTASETLSKESITNTSQQDTEDKTQSKLAMPEQSKDIALENVAKIEEELNRLSTQLINDQTHTDTKLTNDEIWKLNKLEKKIEASEITIESSIEGKTYPKIAGSSTKSTETLKQLEQETLETVGPFDKESMATADDETSEKETTTDETEKETMHTDS